MRCEACYMDDPRLQCNQPDGHPPPHTFTHRVNGVTFWRCDEPPPTTCQTCGQPERRKP